MAPPSCRMKLTDEAAYAMCSGASVCTAPTLSAGMIMPRPIRPMINQSASTTKLVRGA